MKMSVVLLVLTSLASVAAVSLGGLLAYEAILLGPLATPDRIADYRFGSEAMVGHGGAAYKSRVNYVLLTAIPALILLVSAAIGAVGSMRGKKNLCLVALLGTAVGSVFAMRAGG